MQEAGLRLYIRTHGRYVHTGLPSLICTDYLRIEDVMVVVRRKLRECFMLVVHLWGLVHPRTWGFTVESAGKGCYFGYCGSQDCLRGEERRSRTDVRGVTNDRLTLTCPKNIQCYHKPSLQHTGHSAICLSFGNTCSWCWSDILNCAVNLTLANINCR